MAKKTPQDTEETKERKRYFFYMNGLNYAISPSAIKKFYKDHYQEDSGELTYNIVIQGHDSDQTVIKYQDEEVRDKEFLNLVSKLEELDIIFI